jgi:hypothetical protein
MANAGVFNSATTRVRCLSATKFRGILGGSAALKLGRPTFRLFRYWSNSGQRRILTRAETTRRRSETLDYAVSQFSQPVLRITADL